MTPATCQPFDSLPDAQLPRTASTRRSRISLIRYSNGAGRPEGIVTAMPAQDAFVAVYQLRHKRPHEFWSENRSRPVPLSPRGCLHILDLRAEPRSVIRDPVDSLALHLPRAALDDLAEDAGARPVPGLAVPDDWTTRDPVVSRLQPLLLDALGRPVPGNELFVDHLLLALAAHVLHAYGGTPGSRPAKGELAPWQLRRAQEMLAANLGKEASLREIAQECRLSATYFARAFKASTGATPHGWLQACRVARAQNLLLADGVSLAGVAQDCGFADQSHFTRVFCRATGQTPGLWRRARLHNGLRPEMEAG